MLPFSFIPHDIRYEQTNIFCKISEKRESNLNFEKLHMVAPVLNHKRETRIHKQEYCTRFRVKVQDNKYICEFRVACYVSANFVGGKCVSFLSVTVC